MLTEKDSRLLRIMNMPGTGSEHTALGPAEGNSPSHQSTAERRGMVRIQLQYPLSLLAKPYAGTDLNPFTSFDPDGWARWSCRSNSQRTGRSCRAAHADSEIGAQPFAAHSSSQGMGEGRCRRERCEKISSYGPKLQLRKLSACSFYPDVFQVSQT